jgi:hypothetical protein
MNFSCCLQFDDVQFDSQDPHKLEPIADGFAGFNWPDFAIATCAGFACKSFPAETTKTFTRPRLAMAQGGFLFILYPLYIIGTTDAYAT